MFDNFDFDNAKKLPTEMIEKKIALLAYENAMKDKQICECQSFIASNDEKIKKLQEILKERYNK